MSDAIVVAKRDTRLPRDTAITGTGVLGLFLKDAKWMSVGGKPKNRKEGIVQIVRMRTKCKK